MFFEKKINNHTEDCFRYQEGKGKIILTYAQTGVQPKQIISSRAGLKKTK